jgi:protein involved in polysaccharide export with SLBB domain
MNAFLTVCLLVVALLSAGCRAPREDMKMHVGFSEDFKAHICRSSAPNTNSVMRVSVEGDVHHPGPLELPSGSTILDAIKQAGGFTDFAQTRHLVVERRGSRIGFLLRREMMGVRFRNHYRVWYIPARWNRKAQREEPTDRTIRGDAVLEPNDCVYVARLM